ncbi:hypothetical protein ACOCEA_10040 [Maribacter sp. CXY002]|uniref:hypothetical protein n=1 Tax=Maribacter luteocoastalis TaxID=3407671 RepID=UPI003B678E6C
MSAQAQKTILKLNQMTKDDEIIWSVWKTKINSLEGLERLLGNAYFSEVNTKELRIYKYEARHYYDEDAFDWVSHFRLEFIDKNGNTTWQFPEEYVLPDLYESIQYKLSGASEFFGDFLDEE